MMVAVDELVTWARRRWASSTGIGRALLASRRIAPRSKEWTGQCSGALSDTSSACWAVAVNTSVTWASARMWVICWAESDS